MEQRKRGLGRPFQKGQVANPGGRPKVVAQVRNLARARASEAIQTLANIMKDEGSPPAACVAAANAILDRGYGKPAQSLDVNTTRTAVELTDDELSAIARSAVSQEPDDGESVH